jgi:hypothetical protein
MATPFVQGRLRQEALSVAINTICGHCAQPLHLVVDSELRYHVTEPEAEPLVFEPHLTWETFTAPNIIHAY